MGRGGAWQHTTGFHRELVSVVSGEQLLRLVQWGDITAQVPAPCGGAPSLARLERTGVSSGPSNARRSVSLLHEPQ